MKKVVIINQDSGYLMIDIANAFAARDIHCILIAGRLLVRDNLLDERVSFKKIIRYDRRSTFRRLFTWSMAFFQIWVLVFFRYRDSQLLIVSNPPFAPLLPLCCANRFSLLIYDVWPDLLTEFGIFSERSWIVRLWRHANRRVYGRARRIYTITEGMKQSIQSYAENHLIEVVPVWTDNISLKPVSKENNPFISAHGLQGKFVVMYSGNLGFTRNVEAVVELAALIDEPDIIFLIIGDGVRRQRLNDRIMELGLTNCMMLPFQPYQDLTFSLSAADLAIVTLGREASRLEIPSKTYNLMSVGAPLLCIADKTSDLARLVADLNIGEIFLPDKLEEMKAFIIELASNHEKKERFKKNALKASLQFTPENAKLFN